MERREKPNYDFMTTIFADAARRLKGKGDESLERFCQDMLRVCEEENGKQPHNEAEELTPAP
jgi:hypothetical protein